MKHIGKILKEHIEGNRLKKKEIAEKAGISYNYLSTIFKQETCDAMLLEKLYVAAGLHPGMVFDVPDEVESTFKDVWAKTLLGNAKVQINANESLRDLLAEKERIIEEKERTIQILMAGAGLDVTGRKRDSNDQ